MFRPLAETRPPGFAPDPRFAARGGLALAPSPPPPTPVPAEPAPDPVEQARSAGHAAGRAEALAEIAAQGQADEAARARFALSLTRLDAAETARIAGALTETVEALCEALIADIALDPALLRRRAEAAARLLVRAEDERSFRLHPDDMALLGGSLPADWKVMPDPSLDRGSLRIETPAGGVEDGPGQWRQAIAEAIRAC